MDLNEIEVLILSGGKGTRLQKVVSDVPKPMALIDNRPFLHWLIEKLVISDLTKITLLTGYLSQVIEDYFGDGTHFGARIKYSVEDTPLGTGGAFKKAVEQSASKYFLLLNGDTFCNIEYLKVLSKCLLEADVNMFLTKVEDVSRYGSINLDENNFVESLVEKGSVKKSGLINAGIYLLKRNVTSGIPEGFVSLETNILPDLIEKKRVHGVQVEGEFIDIGIPADYTRAQGLIPGLF